jgi:hypothetical protein
MGSIISKPATTPTVKVEQTDTQPTTKPMMAMLRPLGSVADNKLTSQEIKNADKIGKLRGL